MDAGSQAPISQEHAVEDENNQQERRPRELRKPESHGGNRSESQSGAKERNRNRRSGGGKKGAYRFDDQMEHAMCQLVTHRSPRGFPATARNDLATMPPVEVARTESSILLCDRQHPGTHFWPNGDEVA